MENSWKHRKKGVSLNPSTFTKPDRTGLRKKLDDARKRLDDHEQRITQLEKAVRLEKEGKKSA